MGSEVVYVVLGKMHRYTTNQQLIQCTWANSVTGDHEVHVDVYCIAGNIKFGG